MTIFIIMGVSGCGKTTVGKLLAERQQAPFYDGDDFHPPENVAKMARGTPLNDADRHPWLERLHGLIRQHAVGGETAVIACSALKKAYRDQLRGGLRSVQFVHLAGNFDLIWQRMQARKGHFMKPEMLQSQFHALETPTAEEALIISIDQGIEMIVQQIEKRTI